MRIVALLLCAVFLVLSCYSAFFHFDQTVTYTKAVKAVIEANLEWQLGDFKEKALNYFLLFLSDIGNIVFLTFFFIKGLKKTNACNAVSYTYEEYKIIRDAKKAEKKARKKEKLQKQLDQMNAQD